MATLCKHQNGGRQTQSKPPPSHGTISKCGETIMKNRFFNIKSKNLFEALSHKSGLYNCPWGTSEVLLLLLWDLIL